MLADELDFVIGVDTHRDEHALALVACPSGARVQERLIGADERPKRQGGRARAKSDRLDALRAARSLIAAEKPALPRAAARARANARRSARSSATSHATSSDCSRQRRPQLDTHRSVNHTSAA